MITRKMVEIQAETYMEEQFLLTRFPDSVWIPGVRGLYSTFYISETKSKVIERALNEWKVKQNGAR